MASTKLNPFRLAILRSQKNLMSPAQSNKIQKLKKFRPLKNIEQFLKILIRIIYKHQIIIIKSKNSSKWTILLCQQAHQPSLSAPTSSSTAPNNNRTVTMITPLKRVSRLSVNHKKIQKLKINKLTSLPLWWLDGRNLLLPSSHQKTKRMHLLESIPSLILMTWSKVSQSTLNKVISEWEPPRKLTPLLTTSKVPSRAKIKAQSSQKIDHTPWS